MEDARSWSVKGGCGMICYSGAQPPHNRLLVYSTEDARGGIGNVTLMTRCLFMQTNSLPSLTVVVTLSGNWIQQERSGPNPCPSCRSYPKTVSFADKEPL
jgi:hypothetical protein